MGWGGVGAVMGFGCTDHTHIKGPALNQNFIFCNKLLQEVSMPSPNSKPSSCSVLSSTDG